MPTCPGASDDRSWRVSGSAEPLTPAEHDLQRSGGAAPPAFKRALFCAKHQRRRDAGDEPQVMLRRSPPRPRDEAVGTADDLLLCPGPNVSGWAREVAANRVRAARAALDARALRPRERR